MGSLPENSTSVPDLQQAKVKRLHVFACGVRKSKNHLIIPLHMAQDCGIISPEDLRGRVQFPTGGMAQKWVSVSSPQALRALPVREGQIRCEAEADGYSPDGRRFQERYRSRRRSI